MNASHFLIAGAQRAGTTMLVQLLAQHPEIGMAQPLRPEPKFFLRSDALQLGRAGYSKLFEATSAARVLGEKSTSYMERSDIAETVLALLPDVKVVFLLRDPVERAISNYRFSHENGVEAASLTDALHRETEKIPEYDRTRFSASPYAYLARGNYVHHLEQWETALGRHRIYVLLFEDLIRRPSAAEDLVGWLGARGTFRATVPKESLNASTACVKVPDGVRRFLISHFREHNQRLADRYGLDLSLWQQ